MASAAIPSHFFLQALCPHCSLPPGSQSAGASLKEFRILLPNLCLHGIIYGEDMIRSYIDLQSYSSSDAFRLLWRCDGSSVGDTENELQLLRFRVTLGRRCASHLLLTRPQRCDLTRIILHTTLSATQSYCSISHVSQYNDLEMPKDGRI